MVVLSDRFQKTISPGYFSPGFKVIFSEVGETPTESVVVCAEEKVEEKRVTNMLNAKMENIFVFFISNYTRSTHRT